MKSYFFSAESPAGLEDVYSQSPEAETPHKKSTIPRCANEASGDDVRPDLLYFDPIPGASLHTVPAQ